MEADLANRTADFKQYMLEVLNQIGNEKDFNTLTATIYERKKSYLTRALEELSTKHKSLAGHYAEVIKKKCMKKKLLNSSSLELTRCLTRLQENVSEYELGVNKVREEIGDEHYGEINEEAYDQKKRNIKTRLRELTFVYNRLVINLKASLADSRPTAIKLQTLEAEVHTLKAMFSETEIRILARYNSAEEEITVRNSRSENMQDRINEIKKELSEVTQIILKNAIDIRKCKDEPETLKQLYKSIHEEIKAHSGVISGFRQQLTALGVSQLLHSFQIQQLNWDSDSGALIIELETIAEVIAETQREIDMLNNGDNVTNPCSQQGIGKDLDDRRASLSKEMWSYSEVPLRSLEEELEQKITQLEKKVKDQMDSLEDYKSDSE